MKDKNSGSSAESCQEDFSWVNDNRLTEIAKNNYLNFPLEKWKNIVYDKDFNESEFHEEGNYYQVIVSKILKNDIFDGCEFYEEKKGMMKFKFNQVYNINYQALTKDFISPDFFVYRIPLDKFYNILYSRNYMLVFKNNIPPNKKYISILGEIKTSKKLAHKKTIQRLNYINFGGQVNDFKTDEFMILMYIYDQSFYLFVNELNEDSSDDSGNKFPIIYGYIPKLYYENCFEAYNSLITELKSCKPKIDFQDISILKKKGLKNNF